MLHALSEGQRAVWLAQALEPDNPAYNIAEYLEITGPLDVDKMAEAQRRLVHEVDALRLVFRDVAGEPYQFIVSSALLRWEPVLIDVSGVADPTAAATDWMQRDLEKLHLILPRGCCSRSSCFGSVPTYTSGISVFIM